MIQKGITNFGFFGIRRKLRGFNFIELLGERGAFVLERHRQKLDNVYLGVRFVVDKSNQYLNT